jgi:hypothetical protein
MAPNHRRDGQATGRLWRLGRTAHCEKTFPLCFGGARWMAALLHSTAMARKFTITFSGSRRLRHTDSPMNATWPESAVTYRSNASVRSAAVFDECETGYKSRFLRRGRSWVLSDHGSTDCWSNNHHRRRYCVLASGNGKGTGCDA